MSKYSLTAFILVVSMPVALAAATLELVQTIDGDATSVQFGEAMVGIGDVNADGYPDVCIGAPFYDINGVNEGRAYVYYGGPDMDFTADLVLDGAFDFDNFGERMSALGDFNGDSYDDFVVAAPNNDQNGGSAGRIYIYFGGPGVDNVVDLEFGGIIGERLGDALASGDVNGDGFTDLIAGGPGNDDLGSNRGRVAVFFGSATPDSVVDSSGYGEVNSDAYGTAVAAGDINGDGLAEVLISAPFNDEGASNGGKTYSYLGHAEFSLGSYHLASVGGGINGNNGEALAVGGDFNGDGYNDFMIGTPDGAGQGSSRGTVNVYMGGPSFDMSTEFWINGENDFDDFGRAAQFLGDINGDGYDDIALGSEFWGPSNGRAYVFLGRTGMVGAHVATVADIFIQGENSSDNFTRTNIAAPGDLYGDGLDDMVVGAPYADFNFSTSGRAYFYNGYNFGNITPAGGEVWNVGSIETISWNGTERADVSLSVDGGSTFQPIAEGQNVGGAISNSISIRVPHVPTRFARIKISPTVGENGAPGTSDSLFTINADIALLNLKVAPGESGGNLVSWSTKPGLEDLAGYRIERSKDSSSWITLVDLLQENSYHDAAGDPGAAYRLSAINGVGSVFVLGETASAGPRTFLSAGPLPVTGGELSIRFAAGGPGGTGARTRLALYDAAGRLVRMVHDRTVSSGYHTVTWDGLDGNGSRVANGVYFLRSTSATHQTFMKILVAQ